MSARRRVRVDSRFLEQLDRQLGEGRGPAGAPSALDFLRFELPTIEEHFARCFEALAAPIPDRPDYRMVITSGLLVPAISVVGQLLEDGSVLLLGIDLDMDLGWD